MDAETRMTPAMREKLARACATALTGGSPSKPKLIDYAAVDAMLNVLRDPDEAMIDAGDAALEDRGFDPLTGDAEACFQSMIDIITNEGRR